MRTEPFQFLDVVEPDRRSSIAQAGSTRRALPLCVDLDGTLVRTDTLLEGGAGLMLSGQGLRSMARQRPASRAALKHSLAGIVRLDPALLPYNEEFLSYLWSERAAGRSLILVTAADLQVAHAVADHLGLFDEVIASDGIMNLKGVAKCEALCERFGTGNFAYAGDSSADLEVWRAAGSAVIVNAAPSVARAARRLTVIEAEFDSRESLLAAGLEAMRPHQWVKNLLVFIPLFTSHTLGDLNSWFSSLLMFAAFCAAASGVYLCNDIADLSADRQHPRKRNRPFARGALPLLPGAALAVALLLAGLALAALGGNFTTLAVYVLITFCYSFRLKELPLVDVFTLAALYTIRLFAGGEAIGHPLSFWLLAFSCFLFLGLALVKRVAELGSSRGVIRRGYTSADAAFLQMLGASAAMTSSVVLALFVHSEATAERYASPGVLWALMPLLLFWQCRIWLATTRGTMRDDPIVFAAKDKVSWLIAAASIMVLTCAQLPLR